MKTIPPEVPGNRLAFIRLALMAICLLGTAYAGDSPPTISVNFSGGGGEDDNRGGGPYRYDITGTAGVVPVASWNNLLYSTGTAMPLRDQVGNLAASLTYQANTMTGNDINWNMGAVTSSITDPNRGLFNDFLNYFWSDLGGSIALTGLNKTFLEHGYNVIVYFSNPDPANAQKYLLTSGSTTAVRWALTDSGTTFPGFVESTGTTSASAQPGNYVSLKGSAASFTLQGGDYVSSYQRRPAIAGFQVAANPSPAISVNFSGGGGQGNNKAGGPYQFSINSLAGSSPRKNWNNLINSSGSSIALRDDLGNSAATMSYRANATSSANINWHLNAPGTSITDPNQGLYNTFLNYFWSNQGGYIQIAGLGSKFTANDYSVKIYFSNPDGAAKQLYKVISSGTTFQRWALTDSGTTLPPFVESRGTDANSATLANYVTVRGLTSSTLRIEGGDYNTLGGKRPAIAGFQILVEDPMYLYTLKYQWGTQAAFDEAVAVTSMQGIINRDAPKLYVLAYSQSPQWPQYWLSKFTTGQRWLAGRKQTTLPDFAAVAQLATEHGMQGSVVWDENVPATLNVALTAAGVENLAVFSSGFVNTYSNLVPLRRDLRGQFTGVSGVNYNGVAFPTTGSAKNDAYLWAIHLYLNTGRVSPFRAFRSNDAFDDRPRGRLEYATTCDWAVKNRAFVFDLSPWGDVASLDEPNAPIGRDLETHRLILQGLRNLAGSNGLTEIVGWFDYTKYLSPGHDDFLTEQEEIWLTSQYGCYGNGVPNGAYNQSFHCHAPREKLTQKSAVRAVAAQNVVYDSNKVYICFLMGDYDSSGWLYTQLPTYWDSGGRGLCPLTWGINPNLVETYPDIVQYCYETAAETPNGYDMFATDANCAGYIMPNWLPSPLLPLFTEQNRRFFQETDMTIAPMVTDTNQPTSAVKASFAQFATEGYGALVWDPNGHSPSSSYVAPHTVGSMMVFNVVNDISWIQNSPASVIAGHILATMAQSNYASQKFFCFRIAFVHPGEVAGAIAVLKQDHPNFEFVDMHTFLAVYKQSLSP